MGTSSITTEGFQGLIEEIRTLLCLYDRQKIITICKKIRLSNSTSLASTATLNKTANTVVNAGFAALARCIFVRTQKFGIPAGHALSGWALGTRALLFKYTNA